MSWFRSFLLACVGLTLFACALTATRPVQEMSNTAAALKAAKEVQADSRAPELYRQANEWFFKAKQEYKMKNFEEAKNYAARARKFAEEAEYEALSNGANRVSIAAPPDPFAAAAQTNIVAPTPEPSPTPVARMAPPQQQGTFVESYEEHEAQRKQIELEKAQHPPTQPNNIVINQNPFGNLTTPLPAVTTPPATR